MTGHGGWPMTVFLTPGRRAVPRRHLLPAASRGTACPRSGRCWRPSTGRGASSAQEVERRRRERRARRCARPPTSPRRASRSREELLTGALPALRSAYDAELGRLRRRPQVPAGLRRRLPAAAAPAHGRRRCAADGAPARSTAWRSAGCTTSSAAASTATAVDGVWLVPHFEKMLYDNALLATAYLEGFAVTGERRHAEVAERTLDFMLRELRLPEGGFASALDADTDGEEGTTYVWTPAQLREALRRRPGAARRRRTTASRTAGNFEGATTVLRAQGEPPPDLEAIRAALLERRLRRPQPGRDDKAIACWNGLALAALAQGGWRLRPARPARRRPRLRPVPARADDRRRRPAAPHLPRRQRPHPGVPGRPRGGLPRAARAGPRHRRAGVARSPPGGSPTRPSPASPTSATAASSSRQPTPSSWSRRTRSSTTTRRRRATRCSPTSLIRLARIYAEPRARGAGRRGDAARGRRHAPRAARVRPDALGARPAPVRAARGGGGRARGRSGHPRARGRRARRLPPRPWCTRSATAPMPPGSRCSRAAGRSAAPPPRTSASGSPAGRR